MADRFSDEQVEQLEDSMTKIVTAIVQKEVSKQLDEKLPLYLQPINEKLDQIIETETEDTNALNSVVMQNTEDIKLIKRKVGLPVAA